MKLSKLAATPPWEWPIDTGKMLLAVLRDEKAAEADRLLAAELAGELSVTDDAIVEALLSTVVSPDRSEQVRARAAISLGPVLEEADIEGFAGDGDPSISEATFNRIRESLHAVYLDAGLAKEVRRRVLEASVRAPQDWHAEAVRAAYGSGDADWKLTAVFCMRFLRGFDETILEALDSKDLAVRREAVLGAGTLELKEAWERVAALVRAGNTEKPLLLAAIEAAAAIHPRQAMELFDRLSTSEDEEIVDAVEEARAMADLSSDEGEV
jgi:hypothetical protein